MVVSKLERTHILDTAVGVIDDEGPGGLTMRRLAARLDVTATALYYHFDGRQALLDAVADHVCAAITVDPPVEGTWSERLLEPLLRWQRHASLHRRTMGWVLVAYAKEPPVLRLHEAILSVLRDAGFGDDEALHVRGMLLRFCVGHLVIPDLRPDDPLPASSTAWPTYATLSAARRRFDADEHFKLGIEALLDGISNGPLAPRRGRS